MKIFTRHIIAISLTLASSLSFAAEYDFLFTHKWSLLILESRGLIMEKFTKEKPNLSLQKDNKFNAYVGCNRISGTFVVTAPNGLEFNKNIISTKMACDKYFMDVESDFINMLQKVKSWELDDSAKGEKVLNFKTESNSTVAIFADVVVH